MRRLTLILFVLISWPLHAIDDCACATVSPPISTALFEEADLIFVGTVVSEVNHANTKGVELKVEKLWKGPNSDHQRVFSGGECGFTFATGNRYLVVARKIEGRFETNRCSATKGWNRAAAEEITLNKLGPQKDLTSTGPGSTDIWVYGLDIDGTDIKVLAGKPVVEREGYDNQPSFSPNSKQILYTSMYGNQTDIFRYDIMTEKTVRLTNTRESEYSPLAMPDKMHFSVVRVEKDSTQRLWQFPIKGGEPKLISKKIKRVGYHTWIGTNNFAVFIIDEHVKDRSSLHTATLDGKSTKKVYENIGRCLQKIPTESALSYVAKPKDKPPLIEKMNIYTLEISKVIKCLEGSEDFAWTPDGTVLMAKENILFKFRPGVDSGWKNIHTFAEHTHITRLSVSKDGMQLAIVVDE